MTKKSLSSFFSQLALGMLLVMLALVVNLSSVKATGSTISSIPNNQNIGSYNVYNYQGNGTNLEISQIASNVSGTANAYLVSQAASTSPGSRTEDPLEITANSWMVFDGKDGNPQSDTTYTLLNLSQSIKVSNNATLNIVIANGQVQKTVCEYTGSNNAFLTIESGSNVNIYGNVANSKLCNIDTTYNNTGQAGVTGNGTLSIYSGGMYCGAKTNSVSPVQVSNVNVYGGNLRINATSGSTQTAFGDQTTANIEGGFVYCYGSPGPTGSGGAAIPLGGATGSASIKINGNCLVAAAGLNPLPSNVSYTQGMVCSMTNYGAIQGDNPGPGQGPHLTGYTSVLGDVSINWQGYDDLTFVQPTTATTPATLTIPANSTLTIPASANVTMSEGSILSNSGTIIVETEE